MPQLGAICQHSSALPHLPAAANIQNVTFQKRTPRCGDSSSSCFNAPFNRQGNTGHRPSASHASHANKTQTNKKCKKSRRAILHISSAELRLAHLTFYVKKKIKKGGDDLQNCSTLLQQHLVSQSLVIGAFK